MAVWICPVCGYEYDEAAEGEEWASLPDDWVCPVCSVEKSNFERQEDEAQTQVEKTGKERCAVSPNTTAPGCWRSSATRI